MNTQIITLQGCTAEPLMAYLKSLGVLRLVGEQIDSNICGLWENGCFKLTGISDNEKLYKFFLHQYKPSPIITPWNNASGFYPGGPTDLIKSIADSSGERFAFYREAIRQARAILDELGCIKKPDTQQKKLIIGSIRSRLPDPVVDWVDTLGVLTDTKMVFAPLLGTGGNDGRLEFAVNFMQHLLRVIPLDNSKDLCIFYDQSRQWLQAALKGINSPALIKASTGQFNPGGVGGPNSTQGFEGEFMVNPWDYVLMIEGSLFLAGSVACRSGLNSQQKAAFPFTVRPSPAGWHTVAENDLKDARYELWMPLWEKPSGYKEVAHLLREGRAQVGRRPAVTGSDFARSAAALGVDRGLTSFTRFAFYKRSGKAYLASPLGQIPVRFRSNIDLLEEADPWLQRIRRLSQGDMAPESLRRAYRATENAIFSFCRHGRGEEIQGILTGLNSIEKVIAHNKILQANIEPLQRLTLRWLSASDDGSPEYYLARAAASIYQMGSGDSKLPPIRAFLEPVKQERNGGYSWDSDSTTAVWSGNDLTRNLMAVLTRRCLDASRLGLTKHAPVGGFYSARLSDITLFLNGDTDDNKIAALLQAFALLRWPNKDIEHATQAPGGSAPPELSRLYAFCKLFYHHQDMPLSVERLEQAKVIRPYQELLIRLKQGGGEKVVQLVVNKLKAGGFLPLGTGGGRGTRIPSVAAGGEKGSRTAAALLFPIYSIEPLMDLVLRKTHSYDYAAKIKEE